MSDPSTAHYSSTGKLLLLLALLVGAILATMVWAQDVANGSKEASERPPMDNQRLGKLLKQHFPKAPFENNGAGVWMIQVDGDPDRKESAEQADETDPSAESDDSASKDEHEAEVDVMNGMLLVMTDQRANRMRIMMPIQAFDPGKAEDLKTALIALHANYDRALDARYAVSDGILWSAFIHPLGSLTEEDLASAIEQVRTLRKNTGTSYSSGALQFAPGPAEQPDEEQSEVAPGDPTV